MEWKKNALNMEVCGKYSYFQVVLPDFCWEAVLENAKMEYGVLNPPYKLDGDVMFLWMETG